MSSATRERRRRREELQAAVSERDAIREELYRAYSSFRNITDESQMEACILEISALKSKYNNAVKNIKALYI